MVKLTHLPSAVSRELHVISKQSTESPTEEPFGFRAMNFSVFLWTYSKKGHIIELLLDFSLQWTTELSYNFRILHWSQPLGIQPCKGAKTSLSLSSSYKLAPWLDHADNCIESNGPSRCTESFTSQPVKRFCNTTTHVTGTLWTSIWNILYLKIFTKKVCLSNPNNYTDKTYRQYQEKALVQ